LSRKHKFIVNFKKYHSHSKDQFNIGCDPLKIVSKFLPVSLQTNSAFCILLHSHLCVEGDIINKNEVVEADGLKEVFRKKLKRYEKQLINIYLITTALL